MKISVLVSGGVDSSVALRLLAEEGRHELTAWYLKVWLEEEVAHLGNCPWEEDMAYVRALCEQVGVPLQIASLQAEYLERVVSYSLEELRAGRTPSPDIFCNRLIKFGAFLDHAPNCDRVATGHYARLVDSGGVTRMRRAPDPVKDQTYFLSHLRQDQVARALFPIGHLHKAEVRDLARQFDLPTKDRKDSQGICFLGKIQYRDFIDFHLGRRPGDIVEADSGRILGEHNGYWFYTIGQRFGLGLSVGPWYVVGKDLETNRLLVTHADHRQERARSSFEVARLNWIAQAPRRADLKVKLRHGPELCECRIAPSPADGAAGKAAAASGAARFRDSEALRVELDVADPGVAPGQHAVFYDGEECLGGGIIA